MADVSFEDMVGEIAKEPSIEDMVSPREVSFESMVGVAEPTFITPATDAPRPSTYPKTLYEMQAEVYEPLVDGIAEDSAAKQSLMGTLRDVARKTGMEAVAASELALSLASGIVLYLPSKVYGVMALPFGKEAADIAEEEIAKLGYQPFTEKGRRAAEMVGKGFEWFLSPARSVDDLVSRVNPELGYLAEFGAEMAEFITTGGIVRGVRARFKPSIEQAIKLTDAKKELESARIEVKEQAIEGIPDEAMKKAQRSVLEAEKVQVELEDAKAKETVVKQDLKVKGEEVKTVKSGVTIDEAAKVAAEEMGVEYEGTTPEGYVPEGHMFNLTEKTDPMFKGRETTISVKDLKDLPEKVKGKIQEFREPKEVRPERIEPKKVEIEKALKGTGKYTPHGTDMPVFEGRMDISAVEGILKEGIRPGSSTGAQASGYPIVFLFDKGKLGERPVPHRPGDFTTTKTAKPTAVIVDPSAYITTRPSKVVEAELTKRLTELEGKGIPPEDAYVKDRAAKRLADELEKAELEGPFSGEMVMDRVTGLAEEYNVSVYKATLGPEGEVVSAKRAPRLEVPRETEIDWFGEKEAKALVELEKITEVDRQTGVEVPEVKGERSPFYQTAEEAEIFRKLYEERPKAVSESVELFTQKLINDANRGYHGDTTVDVAKARDGLSELATRADELRMDFLDPKDHLAWKETVSDAAEWARGLRSEIEQRPEGVELYSGFPAGKAAELLKDTVKYVRGKLVKSVNPSEVDLLKDITSLYTGGKIDADITYSKGAMWRGTGIEPKHKFDLRKEVEGVVVADVGKNIPLEGSSVESVMFDPPFLVHSTGKKIGMMGERFTTFRSIDELWKFHRDAIGESFRVLKPGGRLVVKIKDLSRHRALVASSAEVYNSAIAEGFKPIDRLIYTPKRYLPLPPRVIEQVTSRKVHVDYWVFEKPKRSYAYPKEGGVRLYAGVPLDAMQKAIVDGAKRFKGYVEHARGIKRFKPLDAARLLNQEFKRSFIDRSGNIRLELLDKLGDAGYDVVQKMYLTKGANSLAANALKQMRKEVYSGLSKAEKAVLDKVVLAERMADIGKYKTEKEFKFPEGLKPTETAAYLELFPQLEKLTPDRAQLIGEKARAYFEWMKRPLKDMLDAELITQEEYNNLASHNYRRIKLVDIFDKRYSAKIGKRKRTVYDSGVEALAKGRTTDIYEPSSEIMALEVFNRAYGRILNNEANRALLDLARSDPKNPFVRHRAKGQSVPSGWQRFFVYEEGQRKAIYLSPDMAKEWIVNNPEISYRMGQFLRYASGSPVLRTFATGINWGFALANLPRDVMHVFFAARMFDGKEWKSVYSPHLPIFLPQIGMDLARTFTDAATRGPRYQKYIEEGGGMEFLVHQGRPFARGRRLEGPADKILDFMGYLGETSEIMTRLAIRDRVIRRRAREQKISMEEARKNKDITREATFAARDYMDFGQGGGITKAADNAMPYLSAAVQGTRGLWRTAVDNPALFSYKVAQIGAATTLIYAAMRNHAPKTTEELEGSIAMQNNVCIPLGDGFSFEDEKGQTRYIYFKIPLDPSQKFFKTFFEGAYDKYAGHEVDVERITNNLLEQSPVGTSSLPPTLSGTLGYMYNKDFWLNEDIWKKTDRPFDWPASKEEYVPGVTPEAFIDLGDITGISPERAQYAVEELTTSGTLWSYLMGEGYDALFADVPKEKKEQHIAMVLSEVPIAKRFIGVTNPYSKHAAGIDEAAEKVTIDHWKQRRELDRLTEGYLFEKSVERKEVSRYIRSFKELRVRDRLQDRFDFQYAVRNLPERSFWLRLQHLDPEVRAERYYAREQAASPEERKRLARERATIGAAGGFFSDTFWDELNKLRRGKEVPE